jgi:hypothetical protein
VSVTQGSLDLIATLLKDRIRTLIAFGLSMGMNVKLDRKGATLDVMDLFKK